jgi:hypothetical protein
VAAQGGEAVSRETTAADLIVAVPLMFLIVCMNAALEGLATMYLWRWYVAPIFGLPALSIVQAFGLSILVGCMSHQHRSSDRKAEAKDLWLVFNPLAYLAFGWLARFLL